jgi:GNAT superfamily N-acetyltransferase
MLGQKASDEGICLQRGIYREEGNRVVHPTVPTLRSLTLADLSQCLALSTEAHWNQIEADWEFLIREAHAIGLELPGEGIVATTVAWDLPPRVSWISMVLVTASCRGRGYARLLMQTALDRAQARGFAAALDATAMGAPVYERLGLAGDEYVVRMKHDGGARRFQSEDAAENIGLMQPSDLDAVIALDAEALGGDRPAMIAAWCRGMASSAWCCRDEAGDLQGFVLCRPGRVATQLGPLVAGSLETARALAAAAVPSSAETVMIDVPKSQPAWLDALQAEGFRIEREFRRMAQPGGRLATDWSRYFAAAGPDFA